MKKIDVIKNKLISADELNSRIAYWRFLEEKIVFTNGCFDIIHYGHIMYLAQAADMGNVLIIGLNSDDSVSRLKGDSRPVNNQHARFMNLASMFFVNGVVVFNEDTPLELIKTIRPDVLVKGSDYSEKEIVGADIVKGYGGEVKRIDYISGFSTSEIVEKL